MAELQTENKAIVKSDFAPDVVRGETLSVYDLFTSVMPGHYVKHDAVHKTGSTVYDMLL